MWDLGLGTTRELALLNAMGGEECSIKAASSPLDWRPVVTQAACNCNYLLFFQDRGEMQDGKKIIVETDRLTAK